MRKVANKSNKNKSAAKSVLLSPEYTENVRKTAYLGKKGYTLLKSSLSPEDLDFLKTDLFLKPEIVGVSYGPPGSKDEGAFPVYRENDKKLYIPRFYGIQRYGLPDTSELEPGMDIDVPFVKSLRDYQEDIVSKYVNFVDQPLSKNSSQRASGGILQVYTGAGKCLGINTPVLMYDGTIKMVQDIVIGDQIMGDDSGPRNVLTLARGRETMYKVQPKKGNGYIVNESHILSVKYTRNLSKSKKKDDILDISVLDYLALPRTYNSHDTGGRLLSGYRVPIIFEEKPIEIDPYLFGYWLGDGSYDRTSIATQEACVIKYMVDCFTPLNILNGTPESVPLDVSRATLPINQLKSTVIFHDHSNSNVHRCKTKHTTLYSRYTGGQYDYRINSIDSNTSHKSNILLNFLKKYNLIKNKHIPHHYLCNSRKIQLELLAGIIDSDGYYSGKNNYEITQKNEKLLDDIVYLCRSLGFYAQKRMCKKTCTNARDINGNICPKQEIYYTTCVGGVGLDEIPVLCPRKKCGKRIAPQDLLKYSFELHKLPEDDYYGFEIDGNRRFVLGDFTVTHNTVMAIKLITQLKKKTMILVHKEFLMNQWIERIQEYAPQARIGKIQAQTYDVDDKDIVIAMIQTMYNRVFPESTYTQFGFTIIDEVHRIGSEEFSKTLLKTITPYMLGISATVERKDKLTKLLYMFIGPLIYSTEKPPDDPVCVRGIEFKTNDPDFNETETDFRGKPKFSTMISKLCDYGARKDFLVRVTQDLCTENPDAQIMILAHNRSLLTYLYEAINHRKFATVGYYVGGMKPNQLKETEEKTVVLATYAMAAEALDIKTLSILILATPKTDIVQSIGRILRMKHERPIVVDIVDSHDIFQNQWARRKTYYRKCNYRIRSISSTEYQGFELDWESDTTWRRVFEPKKKHVTVTDHVTEDLEPETPTTIFKGQCMITDLSF
jgi:superfamily II DNA or RNA helicase